MESRKVRIVLMSIVSFGMVCWLLFANMTSNTDYFTKWNFFSTKSNNSTLHQNEFEAEIVPLQPGPLYKIAFLFLTVKKLFAPHIWNDFFQDKYRRYYNIYVHAKFPDRIPQNQWVLYNNTLPKRLLVRDTNRFQFSLIEASNVLFKYALKDDIWNKKFVLLSESHIPLFNFSTIYDKLMHNNNSYSFYHTDEVHDKRDILRYTNLKANYMRLLSMKREHFKRAQFEERFVPFSVFHQSSQWIVLDRFLIQNYLIKYEKYWNHFYRQSISPSGKFTLICADENYYASMFAKYINEDEKEKLIKNITLTYDKIMPQMPAHAQVFINISSDWIDELRQLKYLFLRKVIPQSSINITYLLH